MANSRQKLLKLINPTPQKKVENLNVVRKEIKDPREERMSLNDGAVKEKNYLEINGNEEINQQDTNVDGKSLEIGADLNAQPKKTEPEKIALSLNDNIKVCILKQFFIYIISGR